MHVPFFGPIYYFIFIQVVIVTQETGNRQFLMCIAKTTVQNVEFLDFNISELQLLTLSLVDF
jgi:hypothetical protein